MVWMIGKFYVVDSFSGPIDGPFDSWIEAETYRKKINIAGDCQIGICFQSDSGKYKLAPVDQNNAIPAD